VINDLGTDALQPGTVFIQVPDLRQGSEHPQTSALTPCNQGLLLAENTSFLPRSIDHTSIQANWLDCTSVVY
jgi:hypothetical protein